MNILLHNAHSIDPKYSQQILACISGLIRNELNLNDTESKIIDIRRNGAVVAHICIQKNSTDYSISLKEAL